ncbi:MAG TPA: hypothetical protein PLA43_20355 [Bryobacteraceae bacterium]|nr:hypothetical protein [Bryobacteraceae bacterium]
MSDRLMTQAEYARHRAKSRQYISRLAKAGVLVMRGGKVDVAASDAVLDDRPEPVSERVAAAPADSTPTGTTFAQARTADMVFKARLRKMEYDQRMGKLMETDLFRQRIEAILVAIKETAMAWPNRVAPEVAPLTDERQVWEVLMREVRVLLNDTRSAVQHAR